MYSNDPGASITHLYISGDVKKFVDIKPRSVRLVGVVGEPLSLEVAVTLYPPFKALDILASPGERIKVEWEEAKAVGAKMYNIRVINTCGAPMNYNETIIIRSDSQTRPEITIPVRGNIRPRPAVISEVPK